MILSEFKKKYKTKEYEIFETKFWKWSLRPHQATLGSGILSLKRHCSKFSDLNLEEYEDLNNIVKVIEPTLFKVFKYDVVNYLMLMMFDNHVHYHIIPRFKEPIIFNGIVWQDSEWPAVPSLVGENISNKEAVEIINVFKQNIYGSGRN